MPTLTPARLRRALLAAVLASCVVPASSSASTLLMAGDDTLVHNGTSGRNTLNVRQVADALIVTDTSGLSNSPSNVPPRTCGQVDRQTMRCPTRFVKRVRSLLEAGQDTAGPINTHLPVVINGGDNGDRYEAGNPSFLTSVDFRGGGGLDTASYAGSAGSGGGRGVRISSDGVADDGRLGLDTDTIGRDVESLAGSRLADEITATADGACCTQFVTGDQGDDVLRAGSGGRSGRTIVFFGGPVADGADRILGGPFPSEITYGERARPVNATLNFGGADDGEAGERDEILGGHEFVRGGQAGDTLRAPATSRAPHDLGGNGGNDTIDGAEGSDTLSGGPGGDAIRGLGGSDRIVAKDGELDTVDCGLQTDTFEVDSIDNFGNCENGTVGVLRLAPKALRAEAGQTARLRLSWRHPQGWRQLRRVELRLLRGDARVGAIRVRVRDAQITADGAARLLRGASRLTRKGKAVSARLALRLDRSLAGERLRLEVEAVDVRGIRQLERNAGSIRVAG